MRAGNWKEKRENAYCEITPEILSLKEQWEKKNFIDSRLYKEYNVKRGLRDEDGRGVLTGLTRVAEIQSYRVTSGADGEHIAPTEGALYYRGIDCRHLVTGSEGRGRFAFEEAAYLLLFGELPTEQQLKDLGNSLDLGEIRLGEEYKDTVKEFEIKLPEGVENLTGKDTVSVSIQFQDLITKTIYVTKIEPKNVPDGMAAKVITKQMPVTVRGPKVQVEAISADDLTVHVDFSDPHGQDSYKALVYVDSGTFDKVGAVGTYHVLADVIEEVVEENLEDE